ncbi:MAG: hypothetical protein A2Z20_05255 [Bdellovibrionales bacterium RBG_16_40_8]|nr:MAG: hypothetical protein A2Z20_05255 [Bdellovibrionales bacterium RBG_16_40_8]
MNSSKLKTPQKGAVKRLREFYEKNRGKASPELIEILKTPSDEKQKDKKSAKPLTDKDIEI